MKILIIFLLLFGIYEANAETPKTESKLTEKKVKRVDLKSDKTNNKSNSGGRNFVDECLKSVNLVGENAVVLCKGATSDWPIVCYHTVNLAGMNATILCNRATSDWPRKCYDSVPLVGRHAAILCSGATSDEQIVCYHVNKENHPGIVGRDAAMACTGRSLEWIDAVNRMGRGDRHTIRRDRKHR